MKSTITLLALVFCSVYSFAQPRQSTLQAPEVFDQEPAAVRDVTGSRTVSEAVAIISTIRNGVYTAAKETAPKRVFNEADYQFLTTKADEFILQRKYDDAILLYKEILKERDDQYAKDRILEAEALRAKKQKEEEQLKQDAFLRAKAEFERSKKFKTSRVHFTGALISDESSNSKWTSKALDTTDAYSSFVEVGKYGDLGKVLFRANSYTMDGIAVPANTRLIIYKDKNFKGEVVLDIAGPAIVNNIIYSEMNPYKQVNDKQFNQDLQPYFPQDVRIWSHSNMREWTGGSMEIIRE